MKIAQEMQDLKINKEDDNSDTDVIRNNKEKLVLLEVGFEELKQNLKKYKRISKSNFKNIEQTSLTMEKFKTVLDTLSDMKGKKD